MRRYSADALAVLTARRYREFQARANRDPLWLVYPTLQSFERALDTALGKRATARKPETMRERERAVFYATVNRDAFKAVLLDTEPTLEASMPGKRTYHRRPPGVAQALAKCRLILKYKERELPDRILAHEQARTVVSEAERVRATAWLNAYNYAREVEQALANARMLRGSNARTPKGMPAKLRELRASVVAAKRAVRDAQVQAREAARLLASTRKRIEVLRQRCVELENY